MALTIARDSEMLQQEATSSSDLDLVRSVSGPRPGFVPLLLRWVALSSLFIFVGAALTMLTVTGHIWDGIGLGAFSAIWGGPGFGLMVAGALWTAADDD